MKMVKKLIKIAIGLLLIITIVVLLNCNLLITKL